MRRQILKWSVLLTGVVLGFAGLRVLMPRLVVWADTTATVANATSDKSISQLTATNNLAVGSSIVESSSNDSESAGNTADTQSEATQVSRSARSMAVETTTVASGTIGTVTWTIDSTGVLHLSGGTFDYLPANASPWAEYSSEITSISIEGTITVSTAPDYANLFANLTSLQTVKGLSDLSLNGVTSLQQIFYKDAQLTAVDFGQTNFSTVTNMSGMFDGCTSLASVDVGEWQTSNVTNMQRIFASCSSLTVLDLSKWEMGDVTNMGSMFLGCTSLTTVGDISDWDTSSATSMAYLFYNCTALTNLGDSNVASWVMGKVTTLQNMFGNCTKLTALDVSDWDTSQVTDLSYVFFGCSGLTTLDVSKWDTGQANTMANTFTNCSRLTSLDLSSWQTAKVTSMQYLFNNCSALTSLNLTGPGWQTTKLTNMTHIFYGMTKLVTLDLTNWDTSNVTTYNLAFSGDQNLQHLTLGSAFSFHGSSSMALPTLTKNTTYAGQWQKGDSGTSYTSDELMVNYDGRTMAGTYNWAKNSGTVTVKYVDGDGAEINSEVSNRMTGIQGQSYTTTPPEISGYTLRTTPDNATGVYNADDVTVTYIYDGNLFFTSTPTTTSFGSHQLSGTLQTYGASVNQALAVQNNGVLGSKWQMTALLENPGFVGKQSQTTLAATLAYQNEGTQSTLTPGASAVIYSQTTTSHNPIDISGGWSATSGLLLTVPSGAATLDTYQATIDWNLGDTVANN